MTNQSLNRLEIFLALALRNGAKQIPAAEDFMPSADFENESTDESFDAILEYLTKSESENFKELQVNLELKTESEKFDWRESVLRKIGTDEQLIDESVHWSHVVDALQKEIPAVQRIIKKKIFPPSKSNLTADSENPEHFEKPSSPLEKTIRRAFAKQFVALRDLSKPKWLDRLSGNELARLIRLAGIREVAFACVRIEAVETVAAFLRRFPAEDARAVAAQLNGLRGASESRLFFAENLVQTALEIEPQPTAMLDSLGIRLIGIALCLSAIEGVRYTNQKLPLEASGKLPEIIDQERRRTPEDLQRQISGEIEQLAETIVRTAGDSKSALRK